MQPRAGFVNLPLRCKNGQQMGTPGTAALVTMGGLKRTGPHLHKHDLSP